MIDTLAQMDGAAAASFFTAEPAPGPLWLQPLREMARMRLGEIGFPTTDQEEWRFTNMAPLLQLPLRLADIRDSQIDPARVEPFRLCRDGYCLVFVDGWFRPELSVPPGPDASFRAGSVRTFWDGDGHELQTHLGRHARCDGNFFTALNTACFCDGAFISVPANVAVERPIQLLYLTASERPGAAVHARNLIVARQGSSVKVVESYASLTGAPHLTNAVTELVLGADAHVEHCRLQDENDRAFHVAAVQGVLERDSRWLSHSIVTGARLARNQIQALFTDEGGEAILSGLYLGRDEQLIDHHTVVDHAKPHCESHEYYYGILAGHAKGVFNGKIFVRQDAQKTNAKQTNRNLVLSERALINTKPQLEIFADDVKCTHGATVGQLNEEALFYLQSRGIGLDMARRMLVRAFANDAVERITLAPARERLEQLLTERFEGIDASISSNGK